MKIIRLATCSGLILLAALPALGQEAGKAGVAASVATVLKMSERDFLGVAEAMPDKLYSFAPPGSGFAGVRTFAEQVKHVACGNSAFFNIIEGKTPPPHCEKGGPLRAATRAELLKYLRESFEYGDRVLSGMSNADGTALTPLGPYWGGNTKLTVALAAIWHISSHYGQLVSYLRMNHIVPPGTAQHPVSVR